MEGSLLLVQRKILNRKDFRFGRVSRRIQTLGKSYPLTTTPWVQGRKESAEKRSLRVGVNSKESWRGKTQDVESLVSLNRPPFKLRKPLRFFGRYWVIVQFSQTENGTCLGSTGKVSRRWVRDTTNHNYESLVNVTWCVLLFVFSRKWKEGGSRVAGCLLCLLSTVSDTGMIPSLEHDWLTVNEKCSYSYPPF